jgi:hypothetical protein
MRPELHVQDPDLDGFNEIAATFRNSLLVLSGAALAIATEGMPDLAVITIKPLLGAFAIEGLRRFVNYAQYIASHKAPETPEPPN